MKKAFLLIIFLMISAGTAWPSDVHWDADFAHVGPFRIGMSYDELKRAAAYPLEDNGTFMRTPDNRIQCGYLNFPSKYNIGVWLTLADDKLAAIHVETTKVVFLNQFKIGDLYSKILETHGKKVTTVSLEEDTDKNGNPTEGIEIPSDNGATEVVFNVSKSPKGYKINYYSIGKEGWTIDIDKNCQ